MNVRKWQTVLLAVLLILTLTACSTEQNAGNSDMDGKLAVTFYADSGTILKIDYVDKGSAAVPPMEPQMSYGMVFRAWDTDFSRVTKALEVRPVCENVKEQVNAFAVGAAYGKTGETVTVPVTLCGQVCVAGFDGTITFDPEALELIGVTEDGAVLYNDEVPGKIRLNYVSVENTEADVDVCRLQFRIKAQSGPVPVTMELHSIYACSSGIDSRDDSMYVPQFRVLDGSVYVIP